MGFLKMIGKGVGSFLLFIGLSALIFSVSMEHFTTYSTLEPMVEGFVTSQVQNQTELDLIYQSILYSCQGKDEISFELGNGQNISINCSEIRELKPSDLPKLGAKEIFNNIYYREWNCSFIECFKESTGEEKMMLLFSEKANEFFKSLIVYSALIVIVGIAIIFVSYDSLKKKLIAIGSTFIITGLPFVFSYFTRSLISLPPEASQYATPVMESIFGYLNTNLMIIFAIGIILVIIGFLIKEKK